MKNHWYLVMVVFQMLYAMEIEKKDQEEIDKTVTKDVLQESPEPNPNHQVSEIEIESEESTKMSLDIIEQDLKAPETSKAESIETVIIKLKNVLFSEKTESTEENSDENILTEEKQSYRYLHDDEKNELLESLKESMNILNENQKDNQDQSQIAQILDYFNKIFTPLILDDDIPIFELTDYNSKFEVPEIDFQPLSDHSDEKMYQKMIDYVFKLLVESQNFQEEDFSFLDSSCPLSNTTLFFISFLEFFEEKRDPFNSQTLVKMFLKTLTYHFDLFIRENLDQPTAGMLDHIISTKNQERILFSVGLFDEQKDHLIDFTITDDRVFIKLGDIIGYSQDFDVIIQYNMPETEEEIKILSETIKFTQLDGYDRMLILRRDENENGISFQDIEGEELNQKVNDEDSLKKWENFFDFKEEGVRPSFYQIFTAQYVEHEHLCYKVFKYVRGTFYKVYNTVYDFFYGKKSKDKED
ncbi:hypothetical protein M153_3200029025 [Pseudoloma neurophilia]|uniref:Uncharacterized protein n=1 Tax=Pseudoloma neurophilia TaxID=146866 RepID=A0A0R0M0L4_9MICR|nr:hypothetical protein M153_3200029025 [Pseudoloma neurophilia]